MSSFDAVGVRLTSNPLLVINGYVLTDCLWCQRCSDTEGWRWRSKGRFTSNPAVACDLWSDFEKLLVITTVASCP